MAYAYSSGEAVVAGESLKQGATRVLHECFAKRLRPSQVAIWEARRENL